MGEYYWETHLAYTTEDGIHIRGYDLVELIGTVPFPSVLYLLYTGELLEPKVAKLIDAVMVASIDHGPGTSSVLAARTAVSGGASLGAAGAAGLLTLGRFHGAAVQDSMEAIQRVVDLAGAMTEAETLDVSADRVVAAWRQAGRRLSGFGHRQHKRKDPRLARLFGLAREAGVSSRYLDAAQALERALKRAVGQALPINIDGAMATILAEARIGVIVSIIAGFGAVISEVGAVMLVGGNIEGKTRTLTTAIVLETRKGNFDLAIALGVILLLITFLINLAVVRSQGKELAD